MPSFLKQGANFIGKYQIEEIMPFSRIFHEKLWTLKSVFTYTGQMLSGISMAN